MSTSYQKLTDGIILYSIAVSDFEPLDFRNDALAGVRANYFNTGCRTQSDETEISIDKIDYKMSYRMSDGSPFSWKVSKNSRPYQSAKRETGGVYCVIYYAENGVIYKRQYFDSKHFWIRTEYFDSGISDELICRIYPITVKGVVLLVKENFSGCSEINKSVLFPSDKAPANRTEALAYSNMGMIWYDESFMPEDFFDDSDNNAFSDDRFNIDVTKFTECSDNGNALELEKLEYLSNENLDTDEEAETQDLQKNNDESSEYSAYDRIEKILAEAHKTNKNLFGEVLEQSEDISKEAESKNEVNLEADEFEKNDEEITDVEIKQEENCDTVVISQSGSYSYYGNLDENGLRTGKGRTVSPDGFTAYDGEYKNGKRDGFGVFYYKNGDINYVGEWQENKRCGAGIGYRSSDKTMHAGKWYDNTPDGYGARFDENGDFIDVSFYKDGIKNGKSVSFDENGNICITIWENGEKISENIIE